MLLVHKVIRNIFTKIQEAELRAVFPDFYKTTPPENSLQPLKKQLYIHFLNAVNPFDPVYWLLMQ